MPGKPCDQPRPDRPLRLQFTLGEVFAALNAASLLASVPTLLAVAGIVAFFTLGGAAIILGLALLQLPLYWTALWLRPAPVDESRNA